MKTRNVSVIFAIFVAAAIVLVFNPRSAAASPDNNDSPLGANLHIFADWSSEYTLVDAFKQSSGWMTQNWSTWNTGEIDEVDFDENGWPRSLQSNEGHADFLWIGTLMFNGIKGHYPAGEYTVLYDGTGALAYDFDAVEVISSEAGKDVVRVEPGKTHLGIRLKIMQTDPQGTGDYVRNIRVLMPGFDETHYQTFHPTFLDNVRKYKVMRYMDWQRTNWSAEGPMRSAEAVEAEWSHPLHDAVSNPYFVNPAEVVAQGRSADSAEWTDRAEMSDVRYTTTSGVPLELMIELANEINADAWFNMPHHASDDYMMQFANMVKHQMAAGSRVYVELSNEVWNSGFYQSQWFEQQGNAEWPDSSASSLQKRLSYFGMRSAQMCDIWETVFGAQSDRVICVIGTQAANPWIGEQMLDCPLWDGAPCHSHNVDAVAIAPYFGQHIGHPAYYNIVKSWTTEWDNGMSKLFNELEWGGQLDDTISRTTLQTAKNNMTAYADLASNRSIDMVAYEGGQHLVGIGSVTWDATLTELFGNANRDPRIASLYADYYAHWRAVGGKMFMHYATVGSYSQWGNWGAKEYADSVGMPKVDANYTYIDTHTCDWEECYPSQTVVPTAVTLSSNSTSAGVSQLLTMLVLVVLTGATVWTKRA